MSALQEPFSQGVSLAHRLDPGGRIVAAGLLAILMAVAQTFATALAGLALALFCLALARLPLKKVVIRLLVANSFILFLWLVLPFTQPGEAVWSLGLLTASREGLLFSGLITLKSNAIIIALNALIATVPSPSTSSTATIPAHATGYPRLSSSRPAGGSGASRNTTR